MEGSDAIVNPIGARTTANCIHFRKSAPGGTALVPRRLLDQARNGSRENVGKNGQELSFETARFGCEPHQSMRANVGCIPKTRTEPMIFFPAPTNGVMRQLISNNRPAASGSS